MAAIINGGVTLELTIKEAKLLMRFLGNSSIAIAVEYGFTQDEAITLLNIYDPLNKLFGKEDNE
jgi:hypothetical protein